LNKGSGREQALVDKDVKKKNEEQKRLRGRPGQLEGRAIHSGSIRFPPSQKRGHTTIKGSGRGSTEKNQQRRGKRREIQ